MSPRAVRSAARNRAPSSLARSPPCIGWYQVSVFFLGGKGVSWWKLVSEKEKKMKKKNEKKKIVTNLAFLDDAPFELGDPPREFLDALAAGIALAAQGHEPLFLRLHRPPRSKGRWRMLSKKKLHRTNGERILNQG
jgi:hypothetical protein